ncbi:Long-chain-fatty-acid--CoA ligase [Clavibacter michiganensis subsp. michiganensis]|uniref:Long-chain-fatty-acid--CoA ligase n=1 Tax=Clavibacter michiganensis subsp. michiganensis TaxID=33013 RepID=A0A251XF81_CLAMM|nr:Long-chain-fatty-acid--CoA ligase [Clavibacter michiganensis subsp. michiganensis]OUE01229.1 Long-chain-fatty-acid--CoA ligase [Clavibacter michiganensis subsp. michiganensis]
MVLEEGATLDEQAGRTTLRAELAAYKVPRRIVVLDELPTSLLGKVLRRKVREGIVEAG